MEPPGVDRVKTWMQANVSSGVDCVKGALPNVLLRIQEVPRLNLGPETGSVDWDFSWFSSVPPGEYCHNILKLGHDASLQSLINWSLIYHPYIRCYVVAVPEKASLNKQ